jgi:hypothetical protein
VSLTNKQCRSKSIRDVTAVHFAVMLANPLTAATINKTATLNVTATVVDTCTIIATAAVFGNLTTTANNDTSGTVEILCTSNQANVTAAVNGGSNPNSNRRQIKSATGDFFISYDVYLISGYSAPVLPNGNVGAPFDNTALTPKIVNIYLRAPKAVYDPREYANSLTITVKYDS